MRRIHWQWVLPLVQVLLASAGIVYGPHEYRARAQRDRVVSTLKYYSQHYPAVSQRVVYGISFPALVLAYPLRNEDNAIYKHNSGYTLIWVTPKDIGFSLGIVLFWFWVGRMVDRSRSPGAASTRTRATTLVGSVCGIGFGLLTGAYAVQMTVSPLQPDKQIGAFGIAWSITLMGYFGRRLVHELTAPTSTAESQ